MSVPVLPTRLADLLCPDLVVEVAGTRRMLERYPDGQGDWRPHPKSRTLTAFGTLDEARLMGNWTLRRGPQVLVTAPRLVLMRRTVVSHLIHRRAQLGTYYRALGVSVPGTFGPSADE